MADPSAAAAGGRGPEREGGQAAEDEEQDDRGTARPADPGRNEKFTAGRFTT